MSTADSEIAILYESHELLADIISPFLYGISGTASEQQAVFISDETLALFAIRVGEFISAPTQAILVDDVPWKHSLLSGLELVAPQLREPSGPALKQCVGVVHDWMETKHTFRFWCGEIDRHLQIAVTQRKLWKAHANLRKHTAFRLGGVMSDLKLWSRTPEFELADADLRVALQAFDAWLRGYVAYSATLVVELLGRVFFDLNRVVSERWEATRETDGSRHILDAPGASAAFADLHRSLLSFKRYDDARISDYTPATSPNLRKPYPV